MEVQTPVNGHTINGNGYEPKYGGYFPDQKKQNGNEASGAGEVKKAKIIDGGSFDWRLAYWTVAGAFVLFCYVQSIIGITTIAAFLGIHVVWQIGLCLGVSGAEGVVVAWLMCPQRGLVSKRQERYLRRGSYAVFIFQILEVVAMYGFQFTEDATLAWLGAAATMVMLSSAMLTVKFVIQHSEERQIQLEYSDARIEDAVATAKIKTSNARLRLQEKKSINDVEAAILRREKQYALTEANSKEAGERIKDISIARVDAVVGSMAKQMEGYAVKLLNSKGAKNAPVSPRQIPGSKK